MNKSKTPFILAKLVRIEGLSERTGLSVRELRTLHYKGILPFYKFGYKSVFYDPEKVIAALGKFEVKAR